MSHAAMYLVIGFGVPSFAPVAVTAQQQPSQVAAQAGAYSPTLLAELQSRVHHADRELASIKQQMAAPLTDETMRVLSERILHLERKLQKLKGDLNLINRSNELCSRYQQFGGLLRLD